MRVNVICILFNQLQYAVGRSERFFHKSLGRSLSDDQATCSHWGLHSSRRWHRRLRAQSCSRRSKRRDVSPQCRYIRCESYIYNEPRTGMLSRYSLDSSIEDTRCFNSDSVVEKGVVWVVEASLWKIRFILTSGSRRCTTWWLASTRLCELKTAAEPGRPEWDSEIEQQGRPTDKDSERG